MDVTNLPKETPSKLWSLQKKIILVGVLVTWRILLLPLQEVNAQPAAGVGKNLCDNSMDIQQLIREAEALLDEIDIMSVECARRAYNLADSLKDERSKAEAMRIWGKAFRIWGNNEKSFELLMHALMYYQKHGSLKDYAKTSTELGETFRANASRNLAIETLYKSLILQKWTNDTYGLMITYNRLAATFFEILYESNYYQRIYQDTYHQPEMAQRKISTSAFLQKQFRKVLNYLSKSDSLAKIHAHSGTIVSNHIIRASLYNNLFQFHEALSEVNQALGLLEKHFSPGDHALSLYNKASILNRMGRNDLALPIAVRSFDMASGYNIPVYIILTSGLLSKIYSEQDNSAEATRFLEISFARRENYYMKNLELKLSHEKLENEIAFRDKELEYQKDRMYFIYLFSFSILTITGLFVVLLLNKNRKLLLLNQQLLKQSLINQEQNKELNKLNIEKDKIFSLIAHDLRSPFNAILGLTEIMASDDYSYTPQEYNSFARSIHKTALSTYNMVENLLEWSRLQRGLVSTEPENLSVNKIFEIITGILQETLQRKSITIVNEFREEFYVWSDLKMTEAILRNIIGNAIKFTDSGGIISIGAHLKPGQRIVIYIRDSGIGIPAEILPYLFEPNDLKNRPGTDGEKSSGLGLVLCREFVERNQGRIWAESEPGKGSTFYIELPSGQPEVSSES